MKIGLFSREPKASANTLAIGPQPNNNNLRQLQR
jgi:hypothetical protein